SKSDCHNEKPFMMTTPCGHRFCEQCSQKAFDRDTCPLCHATIDAVVMSYVDRCPYNEAVLAACWDVFSQSAQKSKKIDAVVMGYVDRCPYNEVVLAACRDVFYHEKSKKIQMQIVTLKKLR
ncbi:hypothetical protein AC249_AIPGENE28032, partial [Exaiptasia diaphana]